jgi:hypothetical protein
VGPQDTFEALFRAVIERHSPELTKWLRMLVETPPPPGIEVLLFVIFSEWERFPVEVGAYNRQLEEVTTSAPFYGSVLEAVEFIPEGAIDHEAYESAGVATYEAGAVVIAEWLGQCWQAANGGRFPFPAFVEHHDAAEAYDLQDQCWVDEASIWE